MNESPAQPVRSKRRRALAAIMLVAAVIALAVLLAPLRRGAGAAEAICRAPPASYRLLARLPHVAARIERGETLTVVALGSSSTAGAGASRPENSYPSRLAIGLRDRLEGLQVRVVNRGVGGEFAGAMAARIDRDVIAEHPDLVIWQVGTNDVLRDRDPALDAAILRDGVQRLKNADIDVVMMDMQYAPAVTAHGRYRDMLHAIDAVGYAEGVPVFHRFAVMRAWSEGNDTPISALLAADGLHMNDRSYGCLAELLADGIVSAVYR